MDQIWIILIVAIISYLIGSISMTRLIARKVDPTVNLDDVDFVDKKTNKRHHLRTVSSTTASMKLGPKVGGLITIFDTLKGAIPVLIVLLLFPGQYYHLIAGVCVVAGHNWSIFNRFTGGGGVSSTNGVFLVVDWIGALVTAIVGMLTGFLVLRDMFLAFLIGPWLMLVWLIVFKGDWPHIIFGIVINLVILLKLSPDIIAYYKNRETEDVDFSSIVEHTGMGRMMLKLMKIFNIDPK
ncbi:MAG TPA: glycerol-3-phosphate acyltransferase [Anaerolineaceae bacterium]|nr:glycerol-3-phosphate acyltransferase [Anaerolineaceae bacterium]